MEKPDVCFTTLKWQFNVALIFHIQKVITTFIVFLSQLSLLEISLHAAIGDFSGFSYIWKRNVRFVLQVFCSSGDLNQPANIQLTQCFHVTLYSSVFLRILCVRSHHNCSLQGSTSPVQVPASLSYYCHHQKSSGLSFPTLIELFYLFDRPFMRHSLCCGMFSCRIFCGKITVQQPFIVPSK